MIFGEEEIRRMENPAERVRAKEMNELAEQSEVYWDNAKQFMVLAVLFYVVGMLMVAFERSVPGVITIVGSGILFLVGHINHKKGMKTAHHLEHHAEELAREAMDKLMREMKGMIDEQKYKREVARRSRSINVSRTRRASSTRSGGTSSGSKEA